MNENDLTKKRFAELDSRAFTKGYTTFSEFLNIDEISTLQSLKLNCVPILFGGYNTATRCIAAFGDNIDFEDFEIVCVQIAPLGQKFADKLTHRDFLGSIMNLGINRNTLGDIIVDQNIGYLFCLKSISEYIISNLSKIKHTSVKCSLLEGTPDVATKPPESKEIIVSSLRADAVVAGVCKMSRSAASSLFGEGKIYINSKQVSKDSTLLKESDIVSVRGWGKFVFNTALRQTKKDRIVASIGIYK